MPVRTVALNALFLYPGRSGGPETFMRGLVPELARTFPVVRFVLVTTNLGAKRLGADGWGEFLDIVRVPCDDGQRARRAFGEQVALPVTARRQHADVIHSLASVAPVFPGVPHVMTFHDVTFLRMQTFSRITTLAMRETVVRPARKADALITGSAAARDEICELLGMDPARFAVVPHGPGRPVGPVGDAAALARRLELEGRRVVVTVGAKRPHKNQELIVRAARDLPEEWVVVLAGHPEPYDAELRSLAAAEGVSERVRFVDYLPDDELEALWSVATVAALPTLGEGFGLPVLEAMRRGVPVACSDIPVLREVAGDDARYFDPHDPASAAAAILAAASDDRLRAASRERAGRFSWRAAAEGTFAAYERAIAAHRGGTPTGGTPSGGTPSDRPGGLGR